MRPPAEGIVAEVVAEVMAGVEEEEEESNDNGLGVSSCFSC